MRKRAKITAEVLLAITVLVLFCGCGSSVSTAQVQTYKSWPLGPFIKQDRVNPIMGPRADSKFWCPVRQESVRWEEKDVFNPSAVVKDGKIHLIYRAEDEVGRFNGTSRIGLAISEDGLNFEREYEPVLYPDNNCFRNYEWEGGLEDPRVVEDEEGTYFMTYSGYDGSNVELMIASSRDLRKWTKHGPAHKKYAERKNKYLKSKAGAIVCRQIGDRHVAVKINNEYYWMYWFNDVDDRNSLVRHMCCSRSTDLINWEPVLDQDGEMKVVFGPIKGKFDSRLTEPGPHALLREEGIVLIYNGMNLPKNNPDRDKKLKGDTYSAGQALFDRDDPSVLVERTDHYFMTPDKKYETEGQINLVCFLEGLVRFKGKYFLYYGTADSKIAVAVWDTRGKE
ncbi:MAG: glycoside hydrolase family 130 protein [Planctomycetota bacterium]